MQAAGPGGTPQEKIVVAGTYELETPPFPSGEVAIRYNLDGTLDSTFGNNGIATNSIVTNSFCGGVVVQGVIAQPRKITLGGWGFQGGNEYVTMMRLTTTGALDTTFGTNGSGKNVLNLGTLGGFGEFRVNATAVQSGNYVAAGYLHLLSSISYLALGRFTTNGLVDTNFGTNGIVLGDVSDAPAAQANGAALQPDGKIVVAGASPLVFDQSDHRTKQHFALARFNSDGSLDTSFGSRGKVFTAIGTNDVAHAVAIQTDGKIVAAGSSLIVSNNQFSVTRYLTNGSLDQTFGNGGMATALIGTGANQARAIQIQPDGKIVLAGIATDATGTNHFALARFTTNGALDGTFGSAGKLTTQFAGGSVDEAFAMGIRADGKIAAAGFTAQTSGGAISSADIGITRYNTNGAPDLSFGTLGHTSANAGSGTLDAGYAMAIQPDGKIIVAGGAGFLALPGPAASNAPVNAIVLLTRFNTNGVLDNSFGNSGTVISQIGAVSDFATSIALQGDGKILVGGASLNGAYQFFAMRYNSDGSPDNSYQNGGAALVNFGTGGDEVPNAMAQDAFGRTVLVGTVGGIFGVARLQGNAIAGPSLKIFLTATNTAVVSWPFPSTGWALQQNPDLTMGVWSLPPQAITNDGVNNFMIVNPPLGNEFYRLIGL